MSGPPAEAAPAAAQTMPGLQAPPLRLRMACWLYEGMLLFAVVFVSGWLFSALAQVRSGMDDRRPLLQAFLFVTFGIYFVAFWSRGQTLAMKTWGIQVVDAAGRRLTQSRALLRYVCSWLWFLPPLAAMAPFDLSGGQYALVVSGWVAVWALLSRFHPHRQFWHDALAGTRLVRAPTKPSPGS